MKTILIDECKAKKYILCVAILPSNTNPVFKLALAKLRMRGQTKIHFVNESDSRKRLILNEYRKLDVEYTFFISSGTSEVLSREKCLRAFVSSLDASDTYQIWLDRDINHVSKDKWVITRELRRLGLENHVEFTHASGSEQSLLWLPDALGWVKNRSGDWARQLVNFKTKTIDLD